MSATHTRDALVIGFSLICSSQTSLEPASPRPFGISKHFLANVQTSARCRDHVRERPCSLAERGRVLATGWRLFRPCATATAVRTATYERNDNRESERRAGDAAATRTWPGDEARSDRGASGRATSIFSSAASCRRTTLGNASPGSNNSEPFEAELAAREESLFQLPFTRQPWTAMSQPSMLARTWRTTLTPRTTRHATNSGRSCTGPRLTRREPAKDLTLKGKLCA